MKRVPKALKPTRRDGLVSEILVLFLSNIFSHARNTVKESICQNSTSNYILRHRNLSVMKGWITKQEEKDSSFYYGLCCYVVISKTVLTDSVVSKTYVASCTKSQFSYFVFNLGQVKVF